MDSKGGQRAVADDFLCTQTGPITDIHIWVSMKGDVNVPINGVTLSIYSDNPVGPSGFSQPAALLWSKNFPSGSFTKRLYYSAPVGMGEWFWDLRSGTLLPNADLNIWQLNFNISPTEAYVQQGSTTPVVYWLVVEAQVPTNSSYWLGWKTRLFPEHYNDDAVWRSTPTSPWVELRYPAGHQYYGDSIDMAFVVTTQTTEPNYLDFGDAPLPYPTTRAANGARHIVVPGILMGALIDSEPDGQPNATATGDDINGLADEDGVTFTTALMPGSWATVNVDLTNCAAGLGLFLNAWVDFDGNGSWADAGDQIFAGVGVAPGVVNSLTFWVPATAKTGTTFARFRLSTTQNLSYTGLATDGEVEDYSVSILEKKAAEHLKWSQPPLEMYPQVPVPEYCGWNEQSWTHDINEFIPAHRVADDFRCIGSMPVTSIHWWGSFINWTSESLPPVMPTKWNVKFYANVIDSNFSHPGALLWQVTVPSDRVCTDYNGIDYHSFYGSESCFQHYIQLKPNEYFKQAKYDTNTIDHTYWLGITAIYPANTTSPYPWGWKTRPQHWMDDAVKYECRVVGYHIDPGSGEIIPDLLCQFWPMQDPITLESVDTAFELDTDPNYIKWEQPYTGIRNWPHYNDEYSMGVETGGILNIFRQAADDWLCEKRMPVTSIVWWGSYLGYNYQPCVQPMMPPPVKPDYFLMNIWTDVPAGDPCNQYLYSHPGQIVWEYKAYNYDEVMVGYDKQPEGQSGPPREAVYRYSLRLPEQNWFKQKQVNQIFWLSIVAVYQNNPPMYPWGWTNHKHFYNDDAVGGVPQQGAPPYWNEILDQTGASADLSFMLFTDPSKCYSCADYDSSGLVNFKDFAQFAVEWMWSGLPGGYNKADLNCDGYVDVADLQIFCNQWLKSCLP